MRSFIKKAVIYLIATGLVLPAWLVSGLLSAERAYAAMPVIASVVFSPTSGVLGIGDSLTMTIDADTDGYTADAILVNGVDVTSIFAVVGGGTGDYTVAYTIGEGETDRGQSEQIPVSVVLTDGITPNPAHTTSPAADQSPAVDANRPAILSAQTKTNTTIEVVFSEDLNGSTVSSSDNEFTVVGHTISGAVESAPGVVTFTVSPLGNGESTTLNFAGDIRDLAGNSITSAGPINVTDGIKPFVTAGSSVTPDPTRAGSITIVVAFSEMMDITVVPTVTVSGIVGAPVAVSQINYMGQVWVGNFTLADNNEVVEAAVSVSDAADPAGNVIIPDVSTITFSVDTLEPVVTVNTIKTNDATPALTGTINDPTTTVSLNVNGVDYAATNNGDGTWVLSDNTVIPALAEGTYNIVATATDSLGNVGTDASVNELVIDLTAPVITLKGVATVDVDQNAVYTDAGATAVDNVDGDITVKIVTTGIVDTTAAGTYTIQYDVVDTAGNAAITVTRTVNVVAPTPPATPSSLTAPTVSAGSTEMNGQRYLKIEWEGVGGSVEAYDIYINNVLSQSIVAAGDDASVKYAKEVKIIKDGNYDVYVSARRGSETAKSAIKTVEFAQAEAAEKPKAQPQSVTAPITRRPVSSVAPQRAQAAAPASDVPTVETPKVEEQPPTESAEESDDEGVIKGGETDESDEINWTPWIILFILILLTGAAVGGYFYWFGGEEDAETTVREVRSAPAESKKVSSSKKKTEKKTKRW
ncbi:MAG: immunoglobulin-like domain-containing protein [Patescibacteria group bacterium]